MRFLLSICKLLIKHRNIMEECKWKHFAILNLHVVVVVAVVVMINMIIIIIIFLCLWFVIVFSIANYLQWRVVVISVLVFVVVMEFFNLIGVVIVAVVANSFVNFPSLICIYDHQHGVVVVVCVVASVIIICSKFYLGFGLKSTFLFSSHLSC